MFASSRGECSTNIRQINSNDNPNKSLINQAKYPSTNIKNSKKHAIEINIVNIFINKTTINQKAIKNESL